MAVFGAGGLEPGTMLQLREKRKKKAAKARTKQSANASERNWKGS
jgi:hypothetical protein